MAFDASKFTAETKPLPVILILDTSGSMSSNMNGKTRIDHLNNAVKTMIDEFKNTVAKEVQINFCAISFSNSPSIHVQMQPIDQVVWNDLHASGGTELGIALRMAKDMIENKEIIPSRAYRPAVILVSDGEPFPNWEEPLKKVIEEGRSAKCDRMAMLIGDQNGAKAMNEFLKGSGNQLFFADDAGSISNFFKFVTMTTKTRTLSQTPNTIVGMPAFDKKNLLQETVVGTFNPVTQTPSAPVTVVIPSSDDGDDDE